MKDGCVYVGKLMPAFPSAAQCSALHVVPVSTCPEFLRPAVTVKPNVDQIHSAVLSIWRLHTHVNH